MHSLWAFSWGIFMDEMTPLPCGHDDRHKIGIEYPLIDPHHYDGISEWRCSKCRKRWGRWTGKELTGKEQEPRYGGPV